MGKNCLINSIKSFLKINKNSAAMFSIIKLFTDFINHWAVYTGLFYDFQRIRVSSFNFCKKSYIWLPNTLRNVEFVYLKLDFACVIFLWYFIISRFFFLIIKTIKYSSLKHWNWFCRKRHHFCEIICPVFTPSQLSINGVIMGHVLFLPWLFLGQWGGSETLFLLSVHVFSFLL